MSDDLSRWAGPIPPPAPAEFADRQAVSQLVKVYALGVDMRDYPLTRSVFADEAFIEGSYSFGPVDEYLPPVHAGAGSFQVTQHNITNQHIVLNGDEALVWSYAIAVHKAAPDSGREDLTLGVQYRDTCRRFPDGWLIVHRKVVPQWAEKAPAPKR